MTAFIVAISPFVVSLVSQGVKKYILPSLTKFGQVNNAWIVLSVAVLAYIAAILQASISGGSLDPASTNVFVTALINFIGATGIFHLSNTTGQALGLIKK